jgi:predicted PurR-regulated permease PerM
MGFGVVSLSEPAVAWAERMPHALKVVERRTRPFLRPMENVSEIAGSVDRLIQVDKSNARTVALDRPGLMELGFGVIVELVMGAVVMFIALYFMLVARQESLTRMLGLAHDHHTASMAATMLPRLEQQVSRYLRVVTAINASLGLAVGISLMLLGMPNPALWGALAAVLTFIPYLGPMVGVAAVALASIVTLPDLSQAMQPPLVYMALATLEGHLITPLVLGSRLKISPLILFV